MSGFAPESFPKELEDQIASADFGDRQRRSVRLLAAVDHMAGVVGLRANEGSHRARKRPPIERIGMFFLSHGTQIGGAVYRLCIDRYGPAAYMLTRGLVEADIDFAYLWLCKRINGPDANDREAWMAYESVTRERVARMWLESQSRRETYGLPRKNQWFSDPVFAEYARQADAFKRRFGRDNWAKVPNLVDRATKVDAMGELRRMTGETLEDDYATCYRLTSELVHGTSAGANAYITVKRQAWTFSTQPEEPYLSAAATMSARFLFDIVVMANHICRLNVDIAAQADASGLKVSTSD